MKAYEWVLNLVDKVSGPMQGILAKGERVEKMFKGVGDSVTNWGKRTAVIGLAATSLGNMTQKLEAAVAPGAQFEQGLADVKAITGATTEQLDMMGASARSMATDFGGSATGNVEAYKGLLSELGPQLADKPDQLARMGMSVVTLSKSMNGDGVGAMKALTTGLQQFNVDLKNPTTAADAMIAQMNIMAASANAGAAEVPQIADSLRLAGVAASGASISFAETNAMIQVLAQGGLKGAEAGTALRNVISKMGEGRFLPKDTRTELKAAGVDIDKLSDKSIPFRERLKELQKVQGDSALVSKLFGMENSNAANVLLRGVGAIGAYEKQIVGTKAAQEAARIETDTFLGRMDIMKARWGDLAIGAFQFLQPMLPMITGIGTLSTGIASAWPMLEMMGNGLKWAGGQAWSLAVSLAGAGGRAALFGWQMSVAAIKGIGTFVLSTIQATLAQYGLNVAMSANPIGAIIAGLLAVSAAVYLIIQNWDVVKDWLIKLGQFMLKMNPFYWLVQGIFALFPGIEKWFGDLWARIKGFLQTMLGGIKSIWDKIAPYLGFGKLELGGFDSPTMKTAFADDPFAGGRSGTDQGLAKSKGVAKGLDKISGGGSRPTTINISIAKFQDKIEIHATTVKEGANDMVRQLEEALVRVVNGVSQGVGIE